MPGFDGTGPLGQGPMTGRGMGFCVLQESKDEPDQFGGLAGIQGTPISSVRNSSITNRKGIINMPYGDGTGPAGIGPMTGRAAGFCAGYSVPGYMNLVEGSAGFYGAAVPRLGRYGANAYGYGAGYGNPWLRRGFGFRRGFGRSRGRGRGRFGFWW
jgi:hypothetical protein